MEGIAGLLNKFSQNIFIPFFPSHQKLFLFFFPPPKMSSKCVLGFFVCLFLRVFFVVCFFEFMASMPGEILLFCWY